MKAVLDSVHIEPTVDLLDPGREQKPDRSENDLWKRMLKDVVERPYDGVGKRYKRLGVSPWVGDKITNELVTMGLATSHLIGFGRRGDTTRFLWPTPEGFKYLGVEEVKLAGKGGFEHTLMQNLVSLGLKKQGFSPRIETSFNGKAADLCFIKDQKAIAVEIETNPNEDHLSVNILKDIRAGFSEVWVLLKTKDQIKRAKEKVSRERDWNLFNGHGEDRQGEDDDPFEGRVHFKLIREFLP